MNNVKVSEVNFTGSGNAASAEYYGFDVQSMKDTQHPAGVAQINVIFIGDTHEVTAIIGLDADDNQQKDPNHLIILPCPPYCGKSGGLNGTKNDEGINDEGKVDFAGAVDIITG